MHEKRRARVDDIITLAARIWEVDRNDLLSPARNKRLSMARQAVYLVAHEHGHSYPHIARMTRRSCHSGPIHGANEALGHEERNPAYAQRLELLRKHAESGEPFVIERERMLELKVSTAVKLKVKRVKPEPVAKPRNMFDNDDAMFSNHWQKKNMAAASTIFVAALKAELNMIERRRRSALA